MEFSKDLIAPCGVNCGVCIGYLRDKNKCCGCLSPGSNKPGHCSKCSLKFCDQHSETEFTYCFECKKFPCLRLRKLDKRYTENYKLSVIGNLKMISQYGLDHFIKNENVKWKCSKCGQVLSIHRNFCLNCKTNYRE